MDISCSKPKFSEITSTIFHSLPMDVMKMILDLINVQDSCTLSITSRSLNNLCWKYLHEQCHICTSEIENSWNTMASIVMRQPCKNPNMIICNGCHVEMNDTFQCSICPWKTHDLDVDYYHFPRDVDTLTWYYNGKKHGYTMM